MISLEAVSCFLLRLARNPSLRLTIPMTVAEASSSAYNILRRYVAAEAHDEVILGELEVL